MPDYYNHETEQAVIGSLLVNPDAMYEVSELLQADDFFVHRHQWIYKVMTTLHSEQKPIDFLTVNNLLAERGQLVELGGPAYLTTLLSQVPSAFHVIEYAKTVAIHSRQRRDMAIANAIVSGVSTGKLDRASIISRLSENAIPVTKQAPISDALEDFVAEVEERAANPDDVWGYRTGFAGIDRLTGGLHLGQTTMIAGTPGVGKSVLAMQIAKNVATTGVPVMIYSFEMGAKQLLTRWVSADAGIPTRDIQSGRMGSHWDQFRQSIQRHKQLPIYINDVHGLTTSQIRAEIARLKHQADIGLIVVDYLNKLLDTGSDDITSAKIKARRLQTICREFNIHGIIIQSMNKEGMRQTVPQLFTMSGPSDVAHEGDSVFLLGKHPEQANVVNLHPAKLRHGDSERAPIPLVWMRGVPMLADYQRR